ncbi:MAG: hypothetical protein E7620_06305 [Ruminococcaceae bacterium]|nr:hypothetical protein [Oscillospiraceae bacterium]
MKKFFRERSYDMVKMFLNQFATAIFGVVLAIAAQKAENTVLRNLTSAFAVLFYLFLLYTMTWELGFKDRASVALGSRKRQPLTGLYISLCANIPNFVFAVFIMLAQLMNVELISAIGGFCATAAVLLEGMYTGLLTNTFMGAALHSYWWMFFIIILPALITCTVAYLLGLSDVKFTGLFNVQYPESDRDPKKKK